MWPSWTKRLFYINFGRKLSIDITKGWKCCISLICHEGTPPNLGGPKYVWLSRDTNDIAWYGERKTLRDPFLPRCKPLTRWPLSHRSNKKHGDRHVARNLAILRAKTRHFRAEESCKGVPATALHREFCAMHFRFHPRGKEERVYPCCGRRWQILYARGDSDHCANGGREWGMFVFLVLRVSWKGLCEILQVVLYSLFVYNVDI